MGITADLNPLEALRLAREGGGIEEPGTYAQLLHEAHPAIAAFGGMFLLMLFLDFIFADRDIRWLVWLERPLARIGKLDQLSVVVALAALATAAQYLAHDPGPVLISGVLGVVTYLLVNALGELFESEGGESEPVTDLPGIHGDAEAIADAVNSPSGPTTLVGVGGRAAFFLFLYLEVLDASFSFDGVIGAFAISQNIFIIAAGLGVGAMYIRSITVYLVRKGTLRDYVYLEHGAHWAIGALALVLLLSLEYDVPEVVTGLIGVGFIAAAYTSSILRNRNEPQAENQSPDRVEISS